MCSRYDSQPSDHFGNCDGAIFNFSGNRFGSLFTVQSGGNQLDYQSLESTIFQ